MDLFIVQPVKIELINAKKLSYSSFPTFDSSDNNDGAGGSDVLDFRCTFGRGDQVLPEADGIVRFERNLFEISLFINNNYL